MLSACLDRASLVMHAGIERLHGALCRSGGALGHGTGPWDDVTGVVKRAIVENFDDFSENFVDVDMRARTLAVDEWMIRRETQSMYWQASTEPIDAFQASMRSMYRRPSRVTQPEADALLVA
jgi:hypothetical protein